MKLTTLLRCITLLSVSLLLFQDIVRAEQTNDPREERLRALEKQDPALGERMRTRMDPSRRGQPQRPTVDPTPGANTALAAGGPVSTDPGYGYSKENPIKLGSPELYEGAAMSQVYLRRLRDNKNQPLQFERVGNVGPDNDSHIVDLYRLVDSSGTEHRIYIDMYHPELNPLVLPAPQGLGITP